MVAGLGVFLPGAKDTGAFWEKLCSGEKQLSHLGEDHFDNEAYAAFPKDSIYHLPRVKAGVVKDFTFNNLKYRMPPTMVKSIERAQILGWRPQIRPCPDPAYCPWTGARSEPG